MVDEIIKEIQQAEQQAADMAANARKQARDIVNQGAQDAKAQALRIVNEKKQQAQAITIEAQKLAHDNAKRHMEAQSRQIEGTADKARENIDAAVKLILERVG